MTPSGRTPGQTQEDRESEELTQQQSSRLRSRALGSTKATSPVQNVESIEKFKTEPTFASPKISVELQTQDRSQLAPGYYFIAPYGGSSTAPHIFDQDGQLIYWGVNEVGSRVTNFAPCAVGSNPYNMCWSEVFYDDWDHQIARNRILNNTYAQVGRDIGAVGGWHYPNSHEFNMLPGGNNMLQTVSDLKSTNLTGYGGPADGWISDGCFQELEISSGLVVFSWCASDHISLDQTTLYLDIEGQRNHTGRAAGLGTFKKPWDFAHVDSVDKTPTGDYILSARHLNAILRVAGRNSTSPGRVVWQLNGKKNDFTFYKGFSFNRPQHVRHVSSGKKNMTISLFNNGMDSSSSGNSNIGQIVKLDEREMLVTLLHEYVHPDWASHWTEHGDSVDGSVDHLSSTGGALIGWGRLPHITEFSASGEPLFHANIGNHTSRTYRAWKKPWVGKPHWQPSVLAYSQNCATASGRHDHDSPTVVYVSWNGATEVASWRVQVSTFSQRGPWQSAGVHPKQGFETKLDVSGSWSTSSHKPFLPFVYIEALDVQGKILGKVTSKTFVPLPKLACDADGCEGLASTYSEEYSRAGDCVRSARNLAPTAVPILLFILCLVLLLVFGRRIRRKIWTFRATNVVDQPVTKTPVNPPVNPINPVRRYFPTGRFNMKRMQSGVDVHRDSASTVVVSSGLVPGAATRRASVVDKADVVK